jgi:hypothetical protein
MRASNLDGMDSPRKKRQTLKPAPPLRDIRYFECEALPDGGAPDDYAGTRYHVSGSLVAWAKRLAALCRWHGVSIGQGHHLYICFCAALREGDVRPIDDRLEPWQRYVLCGLPTAFNRLDEGARAQCVRRATVESLMALAPESGAVLDKLVAIVNRSGDALELPLMEKATRQYQIVIGHTIPPWPERAEVWLTLTERATGRSGRCKLIETQFDDEPGFLVGRVAVIAGNVVIHPKSSADGVYYARKNKVNRFLVPIDKLLQGKASLRPRRASRSRS